MATDVPLKMKALFYEMGREEPLSKVRWWIILRWFLVATILSATIICNTLIGLSLPITTIILLCLPAAFLNAYLHFYYVGLKKRPGLDPKTIDRTTYLQFGTDWIFIALLFHYTGGVASPFLFYFLFHAILTGVLLDRWACLLYTTVVGLTVSTVAILELKGYLPHLNQASFVSPDKQNNPFFVLLLLAFFILVLGASSYFVSALLQRLRERIRQLMTLEQKLEHTNQKLEIINKVAKDTASTLGLLPRLDFICGSIRYLMGVKGAALRLLDERTNQLELVSACGLSAAYINKGPVDADKSLAKALDGEPHLVLDVASDPSVQYPDEAAREGIVSMLSFPLKGRERVIGTLRLYTSQKRTFTEEEMEFLTTLANQGAISIENAKIYDMIKKQDEAKSDFITMMTHEMKGPLMAIQGFLEVMMKGYVGTLTDKQKELVERMYKRIESVLGISSELLHIYQWQAGGLAKKLEKISLTAQVRKAADLFQALAQEKGLSLAVEIPEKELFVMGTEEDLEEILNNLITNAIKYTPPPGTITISHSQRGRQVELYTKDTGIGIQSADLPKVFNEFYRTKQAKELDPDGTGLGLPFVKKVVESLGGTIRAKSEGGKGTEFIVTFFN